MFEKEQQLIEDKIKEYCAANDIPLAELKWKPIPFSGEWGTSTSFFQTAANEARAGKGNNVPVPQRAQEIAEQVKGQIGSVDGVSHIEAVKGYLNVYYKTSDYARRAVDEVLSSKSDFGRGAPKSERIMVEYSQPNTHHSFHIGHSRTTILGESLARLDRVRRLRDHSRIVPRRYRSRCHHGDVGLRQVLSRDRNPKAFTNADNGC